MAVQAFGGPENFAVVDLPVPVPTAGQALVRVEAAGVGLADTFLRRGFFRQPDLPFVPGLEMAGVVEAVGDGGDSSLVGKRVFAQVEEGVKSGCYAEYVAVSQTTLVPLPDKVSSAEAVALGVNALVAKHVVDRGHLTADDRVLVRGAGGGIGVMLAQVAARTASTVVAATSSTERAERLLKLGATDIVDRSAEQHLAGPDRPGDWLSAGFDVILDPVAGPDLPSFIAKLRPNGRLVLAGIAGGVPPAEFGMSIFSPYSLTFSMLSLDSVPLDEKLRGYAEIFDLAARGELQPVIHEVLPLEQAGESHTMLESAAAFGKVILEPTRS